MVCLTGSSESYSRFKSLWPLTHPSPSESSTEKVITLFPNRKPHQKRITFLHKPVKKRAAKWTASPLRSNSAQKLRNIQYPKCAHGPRRWTKLSRDEVLTLSITTPCLWPKAAGQDTGDHCSHHLRGGLLCSPKSNSASKPKRDPMLASQCQAVLSMWMEVICVSFIIKTSCFLLAGL